MALTDTQRRQSLLDLGLDPDGDSLTQNPPPETTQAKPTEPTAPEGVRWAQPGVDPHTMPLDEIVFTDDMLDNFPDLSNPHPASAFLFEQYRSKSADGKDRKDPVRHPELHSKISKFLFEVKRSRATDGIVRERVKTTATQRAIAQILAAKGLTEEDLARLIRVAEKEEQA